MRCACVLEESNNLAVKQLATKVVRLDQGQGSASRVSEKVRRSFLLKQQLADLFLRLENELSFIVVGSTNLQLACICCKVQSGVTVVPPCINDSGRLAQDKHNSLKVPLKRSDVQLVTRAVLLTGGCPQPQQLAWDHLHRSRPAGPKPLALYPTHDNQTRRVSPKTRVHTPNCQRDHRRAVGSKE